MNILKKDKLESLYPIIKEEELHGRQIVFDDLEASIKNLSSKFEKHKIGSSVNNIPIYKITIGNGKTRVLSWSQMHGNESTGTKALFDLFNFLDNSDPYSSIVNQQILNNTSLVFIVLLNPDGAVEFTRVNSQGIDLNRDAVEQKAPESQILRRELNDFNPHYCFNLHDQRSIFNVKGTENPATLSFLAPSEDAERTLTQGRKETMSVIVTMNALLQEMIPNQIGRYTDEFYPTATGDNFQKLGHNTILIEAGHFKDDYDREVTRKYNFYALLQGLYTLGQNEIKLNFKPYFNIPNNDTKYLDIIYTNVTVFEKDQPILSDVGIQIKFEMKDGVFMRIDHIEKIGDLSGYFANNWINANKRGINELELSDS